VCVCVCVCVCGWGGGGVGRPRHHVQWCVLCKAAKVAVVEAYGEMPAMSRPSILLCQERDVRFFPFSPSKLLFHPQHVYTIMKIRWRCPTARLGSTCFSSPPVTNRVKRVATCWQAERIVAVPCYAPPMERWKPSKRRHAQPTVVRRSGGAVAVGGCRATAVQVSP